MGHDIGNIHAAFFSIRKSKEPPADFFSVSFRDREEYGDGRDDSGGRGGTSSRFGGDRDERRVRGGASGARSLEPLGGFICSSSASSPPGGTSGPIPTRAMPE